jgi:hypothetical protein
MPRNYISANVRLGKATNLDQPSLNPTRAESPMHIVYFYRFGPCKQSSFAGHSYCGVFVVDHCIRRDMSADLKKWLTDH